MIILDAKGRSKSMSDNICGDFTNFTQSEQEKRIKSLFG